MPGSSYFRARMVMEDDEGEYVVEFGFDGEEVPLEDEEKLLKEMAEERFGDEAVELIEVSH